MNKAKRKLFVSFSALGYALAALALRKANYKALTNRELQLADLDTGLFALGCTRDHVLHPGAAGEYVERFIHDHPNAYAILRAAVLKAEDENRIVWRIEEYDVMSYTKINGLLQANGFGPLNGTCRKSYNYGYCYPGVKERAELAGLELEVFY